MHLIIWKQTGSIFFSSIAKTQYFPFFFFSKIEKIMKCFTTSLTKHP